MIFSASTRLVLEEYVKTGLKAEMRHGIATPGQRDGVKGLKVLVDAHLPDGNFIPAGSFAYIREESLHNQPWVTKLLSCEKIPGKFMLVELAHVEFFDIPTPEIKGDGRPPALPVSSRP